MKMYTCPNCGALAGDHHATRCSSKLSGVVVAPPVSAGPHEDAMRACLEEVYKLRLAKHHDYTGKPILRRGEQGVVDRLYDKLDRLNSILSKGENQVGETRRDTWADIMAYGLIGMMLFDGTFSLPASWEIEEP